jgi:hypothetical protein
MLGLLLRCAGVRDVTGTARLMLPASDGEARNSGCLPVAVMVGEE